MTEDTKHKPTTVKPDQAADVNGSRDIIKVTDLYKQFNLHSGPVEVLKDINFRVPEESFTIIFGPSGSGKSTLLNVLSGLETPSSGHVEVDGQNIYALDADQRAHFRAQFIGIVHQQNNWVKSLSVLENVALPLYLTGSPKASALEVAMDSLKRVGMVEYHNRLPTVLSGGQQQRVSMARALVATPKIILADEPTGDLDSENGQMIVDLLLYFQREMKRTIILVTHDLKYLPLSTTQLHILDGKLIGVHHGHKMPASIMESLKAQLAELTKMEEGE
jgi:ABC-type lipoprotein export system ATPase subunit